MFQAFYIFKEINNNVNAYNYDFSNWCVKRPLGYRNNYHSMFQGRVLTGFLFPVNPMKKKKKKKKKKKNPRGPPPPPKKKKKKKIPCGVTRPPGDHDS